MLSDVLNLVVIPKKAAASPANILRLIQFRNFCCCEGIRREKKHAQAGKQRFSARFLQTYALILTLANTIGGGLPPSAMQQQEEAHSLKTKFHPVTQ